MAIIGMSHTAFGGGKADGYHTVFVSQDEEETGYGITTSFEGWVAKQQYQSDEWEWNPSAPPEAVFAARQHFVF